MPNNPDQQGFKAPSIFFIPKEGGPVLTFGEWSAFLRELTLTLNSMLDYTNSEIYRNPNLPTQQQIQALAQLPSLVNSSKSVPNNSMAQVPAFTIKGNNLSTAANPADLTATQVYSLLGPYQQTTFSNYHAFGDSITAGAGANPYYVLNLQNESGAITVNNGTSGYLAYNMNDGQIFPNENPTIINSTVYSIMIGTNDANNKGVGTYEAVYQNCLQAGASWLAIPTLYKVMGQDAGNTNTGTWVNDNTYQTGIGFKSTTNASTLSMTITTYGGPIYLWYRTIDGDAGVFNWQLDGGTATSVNGFTTPISGGQSVGVVRIPNVTSGSHVVKVTVTSATNAANVVSILGVGTTPGLVRYKCPKVFVSGVIRQQNDANAAATAAYDADAMSIIQGLTADGLDVWFVNVRNYVNSTTDMLNALHPNNTGHRHIADAFEAVMQWSSEPAFFNPLLIHLPAPADITQYTQVNADNNVSATALNGGITIYKDGSNSFGLDFGHDGNGYSTRLFSTQMISLAQSPALPTAQANFTNRILLNCATGQVFNFTTAPTDTSKYFVLNANGLASTTALNPGYSLFFGTDTFGAHLASSGGVYRHQLFTSSTGSFSFAKGNGTNAAQSDFTDLMTIANNGNVKIISGTLDMNSHKIINLTNGSSASDAATFGQIPSTSGLVPYSGATGNVDLNAKYLVNVNGIAVGGSTVPSAGIIDISALSTGGFNLPNADLSGATGNGWIMGGGRNLLAIGSNNHVNINAPSAGGGQFVFVTGGGEGQTVLGRLLNTGLMRIGDSGTPTKVFEVAGDILLTGVTFNNSAKTTVNGSISGTIIWTMPEQGSAYKKMVLQVNALHDAGTSITFPVAFNTAPIVSANNTSLAVTTSTTQVTFPISAVVSGWVVVEGF